MILGFDSCDKVYSNFINWDQIKIGKFGLQQFEVLSFGFVKFEVLVDMLVNGDVQK